MEPECPAKVDEILSRHEKSQCSLIPIIQEIQKAFGYLPREVLLRVADYLRLPPSTVYGVATFYAQFRLHPRGRHEVKVCQGTACHVRGGKAVMDAVRNTLGIGPGETTPDLGFSLERVACLGSCALGPVVVVDEVIYGTMTPAGVAQLTRALANRVGTTPGEGEAKAHPKRRRVMQS